MWFLYTYLRSGYGTVKQRYGTVKEGYGIGHGTVKEGYGTWYGMVGHRHGTLEHGYRTVLHVYRILNLCMVHIWYTTVRPGILGNITST